MADTPQIFVFTINHDNVEHQLKFVFDLSRFSHKVIYSFLGSNQLYEPGTSRLLLQLLKPGDVFIDVGGHIGYFTLLASKLVGPTGRVYCFEPEARNHQQLLNHLRLNEATNVLPFKWAVSDSTGVVDFFICPENDGGHAMWDLRQRDRGEYGQKVEQQSIFAIPLDSIFANAQPGAVKAIKIDVEGFELHALRGMKNLLAGAKVPVVIAEINREMMQYGQSTEQDIRDFMVNLGYLIFADNPETGELTALERTQPYPTKYVFNLVFIRPEIITVNPSPTSPAPAETPAT